MNSEQVQVSQDPRLKELDDLLILAEQSTNNIDRFLSVIDRLRTQFLLYIVVGYVLLGIGFGLIFLERESQGLLSPLGFTVTRIAGIITASFIAGMSVWTAFSRQQRLRAVRRDAHTEHDIHARLLSLIDEQYRRVKQNGLLSSVGQATVEIRLRRLDRTDRRK